MSRKKCEPGCVCKKHNNPNHYKRKPCPTGCTCAYHNPRPSRRKHSIDCKCDLHIVHSERMKTYWSDPAYKAKNLYRRKQPTSIEQILLNNMALIYGPDQVESEYPILGYSIDCAVPYLKLAFEADGGYWHNKELDAIRDADVTKEGWQVYRFPDYQLNKWETTTNIVTAKFPSRHKCPIGCNCGRHKRKGKTHEEIYGIEKSKVLKENTSIKVSLALTGRNLSLETRKAISISMTGKHWKWSKNV